MFSARRVDIRRLYRVLGDKPFVNQPGSASFTWRMFNVVCLDVRIRSANMTYAFFEKYFQVHILGGYVNYIFKDM